MAAQYGFLGGATGGIVGYRSDTKASEAIGILAGATIGAIAGSYVTNDTYIIIVRVTIGILDQGKHYKKTVEFSSSPNLQDDEYNGIVNFQKVMTTRVAVYAGGSNVMQREIVPGVKRRLQGILSDII